MKNYTMFSYEWLFADHFAKLSEQARLFYIKLNFYANNGFVANPLQVLDSLGYDRSILNELILNEDILCLKDRCEVFITAFFVHNKGVNPMSWKYTPFFPYWDGKLYVKKNGIATFKPQKKGWSLADAIYQFDTPKGESAAWDERLEPLKNN